VRPLRFALVLVTVLTLQTTFISEVTVFGARGDILLLVAIAAGISGGAERGAVAGFAAGIVFDLLLQTPFGLSALTYCLVGYGVGMLQGSVLRASWWIPVLSALGASVMGITAFAVFGEVLGQNEFITDRLPRVAVVVAVINAACVLPMVRVLRWSLRPEPSPGRVGAPRYG
jgi:rod shape-determining protein MreD